VLEGLGLRHFFGETVGGDTPFGRKPAIAGLLHLAQSVMISPHQVLLVGDSAVDLATARNATASICLARYGFGYRFTAEDFRGDEWFIDRPQDLLALLES
jgi:phosphoglycolate phosphatase